jgi:transcriptional regulator with XRE-family HTH domain
MSDKQNIGPTIRARREAANLTQSALARALGCADTMISRWESGRATPRLRYAEKLAVALGGVAADYCETK